MTVQEAAAKVGNRVGFGVRCENCKHFVPSEKAEHQGRKFCSNPKSFKFDILTSPKNEGCQWYTKKGGAR